MWAWDINYKSKYNNKNLINSLVLEWYSAWKVSKYGVFSNLFLILAFSKLIIWTEDGEIHGVYSGPYFPAFGLRISPYSVRMQENTDQKKLRIWTLFFEWYSGHFGISKTIQRINAFRLKSVKIIYRTDFFHFFFFFFAFKFSSRWNVEALSLEN